MIESNMSCSQFHAATTSFCVHNSKQQQQLIPSPQTQLPPVHVSLLLLLSAMTHTYQTRRRRATKPAPSSITKEQTEQPAQLPAQPSMLPIAKSTSGSQNKNDTKMSQSARKASAQTVAPVQSGMDDHAITENAHAAGDSAEQKTTYEMPSSDDCPIFLRKTYKMIDACDPKIAGWSCDGTSFLVRDTDRLAKATIPQYFKHNKWSSFVRQLNFYGFKKVKSEAVTLEEEEQLEGTVRFRHDSFLRGRPDLLMEIHRKKMAADGKAKQLKLAAGAAGTGRTAGGAIGTNNVPADLGVADAASKSEVKALRDRIAAMSQNIDDLSAMVKNMQVRDDGAATEDFMSEYGNVGAGTKRKKVGAPASMNAPILPESVGSSSDMMVIDDELPDVAPEEVKRFDPSIAFTPGNIFPSVSSVGAASCSRQASMAGSDGAFVDDLFAFNEEGLLGGPAEDEPMASGENMGGTAQPENVGPDPKLMKELTDALTLLPKEMQDTLVNRMISTIVGMGPDSLRSQLNSTGGSSIASASASVASRAASPKPRAVVESDEKVSTPVGAMERKTVVVAASPDKNDDSKSEIAIQIDSAMFNSLVKHLAKTQGAAGKTDKILPPTVAVH